MADKCGMSHQLQKSQGLGGRMEEASHSHKGFRFALGVLESCRRVCGGLDCMIQGPSSAGLAQDMGGKRARIGVTLKEDLVSSFLTSRSVQGAPVKASQASGGHSFPCARPHLLTTNKR